jgi:hypothetical protein
LSETFGQALTGISGSPSGVQHRLRPSTPADAPAIIKLLSDAGLDATPESRSLQWKYWQDHDERPGPRSYVLTNGSDLLAHAAILQTSCSWGTERLRMAHAIDWAASRRSPGAGVALMKQIGRLTDALFAIGGSAETLQILPLVGFRECGVVTGYVRPLFPLRLQGRPGNVGVKLLPRLVRNTVWALTATDQLPDGWQARELGVGELDRIGSVVPKSRDGVAVLERTQGLFSYVLTCPIVPIRLYALEYSGSVRGYFMLAFCKAQTRLVDCWVDSENSSDWRALIGCAVREAKRDAHAVELATWANDRLLATSLIESGFHPRFTLPIFIRSGSARMPPDPFRVQMLDNDAAYLNADSGTLWA